MNSLQAELLKVEIKPKNKPVMVDAVKVAGKTFTIRGNVLKTASLNREWQYDVDNPEEVIRVFKDSNMQIDLLKFWQRIPETEPRYQYYREWRQVAVPKADGR